MANQAEENKKSRRIWLDVTAIMYWNATPVGIIRVELEFARFFLNYQQERSVHFISYCMLQRCYIEVSRNSLQKCIQRLEWCINKTSEDKFSINTMLSYLDKIGLKVLRKVVDRGFRLLRNQKILFTFRKKPAFNSTDIVITAGMPWVCPGFHSYIKKLILTSHFYFINVVYDLIPILLPQFTSVFLSSNFKQFYDAILDKTHLFLCISNKTKNDLEAYAKLSNIAIKGDVLKFGASQIAKNNNVAIESILEKYQIRRKYTMFVSSMDERKNHILLYQAYQWLLSEGHHDLPMMLWIGKPSEATRALINQIKRNPAVQDYIRVLTNIDDTVLATLYQHCQYTLFPSLYEGWGMPVDESLGYGKLSICSSFGSLPEVGGKLAIYLNPYDVRAWADVILDFSKNPDKLLHHQQTITREYKQITWQEGLQESLSPYIL